MPPPVNDSQYNRRTVGGVQALKENYVPAAVDRPHAWDQEAAVRAGFRVPRDPVKGVCNLAVIRQPLRSAPCLDRKVADVLKV